MGSNAPSITDIRVRVMVFNATFTNISVISWRSLQKTTKLPQVTDKLFHINVVLSRPRPSGI